MPGPVPARRPVKPLSEPLVVHEPCTLVDVEALIKVHIARERRRLAAQLRVAASSAPLLWRAKVKESIEPLARRIEAVD